MKRIVFIILCYGIMFTTSCNFGANTKKSDTETKPAIAYGVIPSSLESAKEQIKNTTWVASPRGESWFKVFFKGDGTYTCWYAEPGNGEWCNTPITGNYEVREGRYSDTGERFYAVPFDSKILMPGSRKLGINAEYIDIKLLFMMGTNSIRSSAQSLLMYDEVKCQYGNINPWK